MFLALATLQLALWETLCTTIFNMLAQWMRFLFDAEKGRSGANFGLLVTVIFECCVVKVDSKLLSETVVLLLFSCVGDTV